MKIQLRLFKKLCGLKITKRNQAILHYFLFHWKSLLSFGTTRKYVVPRTFRAMHWNCKSRDIKNEPKGLQSFGNNFLCEIKDFIGKYNSLCEIETHCLFSKPCKIRFVPLFQMKHTLVMDWTMFDVRSYIWRQK